MRLPASLLALLTLFYASHRNLPAEEVRFRNTGGRPNMIVLYADDAGYSDFGFQPTARDDMKQLTPHIDSIAADGMRFEQAYMSSCVCSPSRAGFMTGRYQGRFGFDNNLPPGTQSGLDLEETFFAKRLQRLGYRTGLIGKWHLGYPEEYHPNARGFDTFHGLLQGSRSYFPIENPSPHRVFLDNRTPTPEGGYTTDRIGDAAVRFLRQDDKRPFFLFVSFTAPHGPLEAKPEIVERLNSIKRPRRRKYAGLVVSLDDNIGKILSALAESGLDQSTVVLFTNDNGGQTQTGANNLPLRGLKGTLYEGGIRVPWAVKWPGQIPAGSVQKTPVTALDLAPTFLELAGALPDPEWNLDGDSIVRLLVDAAATLPERPLFWRIRGPNGLLAVRMGPWKMVHRRNEGANPELYRLDRDLPEQDDLAESEPDRLKQLQRLADQWESLLEDPRWGNRPGPRRSSKAARPED